MRLSPALTIALGVVLNSDIPSGTAVAGELDKPGCERRESTRTAEGVAYDAPGGGKIGHLSSETRYVAVTHLRHRDDDNWLLLTGPGGAHVGWIRADQVKSHQLGLTCPIDLFYRRP
jgi:hypothetical protein